MQVPEVIADGTEPKEPFPGGMERGMSRRDSGRHAAGMDRLDSDGWGARRGGGAGGAGGGPPSPMQDVRFAGGPGGPGGGARDGGRQMSAQASMGRADSRRAVAGNKEQHYCSMVTGVYTTVCACCCSYLEYWLQ